MRILFVIPYFYPAESFGGPVTIAFVEAKELVRLGHEVVVYTSDAKDLTDRLDVSEAIYDGVKVKYFRNLSMWLVGLSKLFITRQMKGELARELTNFDIIHLHEYTTYQNIIVHNLSKKLGIPYILQAHGSLPIIGRKSRKMLFDALFGRSLLCDSSGVIALNKTEAQQYLKSGVCKEKIAIIPNGINVSEYSKKFSKGYFHKKLNLPIAERKILFLGRLNEIKGVDILIKAFAVACRSLDDVTLIIVGPDEGFFQELTKIVSKLNLQKSVIFTGALYGEEKLLAYFDSEIYVLPSRYETFPMGLLEAQLCGLPVIVSDSKGLTEIVQDKVTGLIVKRENVNELASALELLLTDSKFAATLGRNGREYVFNTFSVENVAKSLENLYIKTINGMPHRRNSG
jgi:glycosyltransferase involved in cell wall biosynthesis